MDSTPKNAVNSDSANSNSTSVSFDYPTLSVNSDSKKVDSTLPTSSATAGDSPSPAPQVVQPSTSTSPVPPQTPSNSALNSGIADAAQSRSSKPDDLDKQFDEKEASVPPVVPAPTPSENILNEQAGSKDSNTSLSDSKKSSEKHGFSGLKALAKRLSGLKEEFVEEVDGSSDAEKIADTTEASGLSDKDALSSEIEETADNDSGSTIFADDKSGETATGGEVATPIPVIPVNSDELKGYKETAALDPLPSTAKLELPKSDLAQSDPDKSDISADVTDPSSETDIPNDSKVDAMIDQLDSGSLDILPASESVEQDNSVDHSDAASGNNSGSNQTNTPDIQTGSTEKDQNSSANDGMIDQTASDADGESSELTKSVVEDEASTTPTLQSDLDSVAGSVDSASVLLEPTIPGQKSKLNPPALEVSEKNTEVGLPNSDLGQGPMTMDPKSVDADISPDKISQSISKVEDNPSSLSETTPANSQNQITDSNSDNGTESKILDIQTKVDPPESSKPEVAADLNSPYPFTIHQLLDMVIERGASDLHLTVKYPAMLRVDGKLAPVADARPLTQDDAVELILPLLPEQKKELLEVNREVDFAYAHKEDARFRINSYYQKQTLAAALRLIPNTIRSIDDLRLPQIYHQLTKLRQGLVLVTGPTGSGKSTTLAAIIQEINETRPDHVITIEDPIEYIFPLGQAMIDQRELHDDTHSWEIALKSALRQDPDVILVGEMRDYETIAAAITLAETGHLVFATLHTNSAAQTVDRIIDVFPEHQQPQVRSQLSNVLESVVAQRLIPLNGGGRSAVSEIMIATPAVRNLIREAKTHQLDNVIRTSADVGMISLEHSLVSLVRENLINMDRAQEYAVHPEEIVRLLKA